MQTQHLLMVGLLACDLSRSVAAADAVEPRTPALEELPRQERVSQYGITWTFREPVRVGKFVNWDYYVVGPVEVVAIDPSPLYASEIPRSELDNNEKTRRKPEHLVRNGFMVNPPPRAEVAYDSAIYNYFKPELTARLPVTLKPGDTLVSSISLRQGEESRFPFHSGGPRAVHNNCPSKVAAVLTCMAAPQPSDAFRPGYCDRQQEIFLARNLRRDLLPTLKRPRRVPLLLPFSDVFLKPWLNTAFFGFEQPM